MQESLSTKLVQPDPVTHGSTPIAPPVVPDYLRDVYGWAYLNPSSVRLFERQWIVNLILWGNYVQLRDRALDELGQGLDGRTLQVACVYGDFTPKLHQRLGSDGVLNVVDVAPIQLENLGRKMGPRDNVLLAQQDASSLEFPDGSFDRAVVFFLLHELPAEVREKALAEVLRVVRPGGKLVFVDYHRPVAFHPHRYIMKPILSLLEPFALDLWDREIEAWMPSALQPRHICKTTYFGGLYQKVTAIR